MAEMSASFAALDDELDIKSAAAAIRATTWVVRSAIHDGRLKAWIPGGRDPIHAGRGLGYRIKKQDLHDWWFGKDQE